MADKVDDDTMMIPKIVNVFSLAKCRDDGSTSALSGITTSQHPMLHKAAKTEQNQPKRTKTKNEQTSSLLAISHMTHMKVNSNSLQNKPILLPSSQPSLPVSRLLTTMPLSQLTCLYPSHLPAMGTNIQILPRKKIAIPASFSKQPFVIPTSSSSETTIRKQSFDSCSKNPFVNISEDTLNKIAEDLTFKQNSLRMSCRRPVILDNSKVLLPNLKTVSEGKIIVVTSALLLSNAMSATTITTAMTAMRYHPQQTIITASEQKAITVPFLKNNLSGSSISTSTTSNYHVQSTIEAPKDSTYSLASVDNIAEDEAMEIAASLFIVTPEEDNDKETVTSKVESRQSNLTLDPIDQEINDNIVESIANRNKQSDSDEKGGTLVDKKDDEESDTYTVSSSSEDEGAFDESDESEYNPSDHSDSDTDSSAESDVSIQNAMETCSAKAASITSLFKKAKTTLTTMTSGHNKSVSASNRSISHNVKTIQVVKNRVEPAKLSSLCIGTLVNNSSPLSKYPYIQPKVATTRNSVTIKQFADLQSGGISSSTKPSLSVVSMVGTNQQVSNDMSRTFEKMNRLKLPKQNQEEATRQLHESKTYELTQDNSTTSSNAIFRKMEQKTDTLVSNKMEHPVNDSCKTNKSIPLDKSSVQSIISTSTEIKKALPFSSKKYNLRVRTPQPAVTTTGTATSIPSPLKACRTDTIDVIGGLTAVSLSAKSMKVPNTQTTVPMYLIAQPQSNDTNQIYLMRNKNSDKIPLKLKKLSSGEFQIVTNPTPRISSKPPMKQLRQIAPANTQHIRYKAALSGTPNSTISSMVKPVTKSVAPVLSTNVLTGIQSVGRIVQAAKTTRTEVVTLSSLCTIVSNATSTILNATSTTMNATSTNQKLNDIKKKDIATSQIISKLVKVSVPTEPGQQRKPVMSAMSSFNKQQPVKTTVEVNQLVLSPDGQFIFSPGQSVQSCIATTQPSRGQFTFLHGQPVQPGVATTQASSRQFTISSGQPVQLGVATTQASSRQFTISSGQPVQPGVATTQASRNQFIISSVQPGVATTQASYRRFIISPAQPVITTQASRNITYTGTRSLLPASMNNSNKALNNIRLAPKPIVQAVQNMNSTFVVTNSKISATSPLTNAVILGSGIPNNEGMQRNQMTTPAIQPVISLGNFVNSIKPKPAQSIINATAILTPSTKNIKIANVAASNQIVETGGKRYLLRNNQCIPVKDCRILTTQSNTTKSSSPIHTSTLTGKQLLQKIPTSVTQGKPLLPVVQLKSVAVGQSTQKCQSPVAQLAQKAQLIKVNGQNVLCFLPAQNNVSKPNHTTTSSIVSSSGTLISKSNLQSTPQTKIFKTSEVPTSVPSRSLKRASVSVSGVDIQLGITEKLFTMQGKKRKRCKFLPNVFDNKFSALLGLECCMEELNGDYFNIRTGAPNIDVSEYYKNFLNGKRKKITRVNQRGVRLRKLIEVVVSDDENQRMEGSEIRKEAPTKESETELQRATSTSNMSTAPELQRATSTSNISTAPELHRETSTSIISTAPELQRATSTSNISTAPELQRATSTSNISTAPELQRASSASNISTAPDLQRTSATSSNIVTSQKTMVPNPNQCKRKNDENVGLNVKRIKTDSDVLIVDTYKDDDDERALLEITDHNTDVSLFEWGNGLHVNEIETNFEKIGEEVNGDTETVTENKSDSEKVTKREGSEESLPSEGKETFMNNCVKSTDTSAVNEVESDVSNESSSDNLVDPLMLSPSKLNPTVVIENISMLATQKEASLYR